MSNQEINLETLIGLVQATVHTINFLIGLIYSIIFGFEYYRNVMFVNRANTKANKKLLEIALANNANTDITIPKCNNSHNIMDNINNVNIDNIE